MKMDAELLHSPVVGLSEEEEADMSDWNLPLAFMKKRHLEKIEGSKALAQSWRMKDRMKTVSVALVLCLNVGVDPPDVVKTSPCARLECWIDPLSMSPQKALETIGANLQKQYENWQPRARYKQSLDPTVDEVKKLCTSLRRNAKEERVLFHYNGHGVPRPTVNGEIWVFNKNYTQYIPLSIYDLQTWMGSPSIFVYDCSNAGIIVKSFKQFALQREQELEVAAINPNHPLAQMPLPPSMKNCIQLAACEASELLPMNPDLPADLFTSCLTTPIKIALRWFCMQKSAKLVPGVTLDLIEKIPGRLNDRRTPLGELNWIFTAITDTIAWNVLPRDLFQKLFRQDLLVASLFRNFLLAERIMRSYNCTPVSSPRLPPTYMHAMWQAWDLAVDICLSQLPTIIEEGTAFRHSPFFAEQLTAFQVWLTMGVENRNPPEQLPIVLQVLLSQVHRLRALDLLGRFLDLGPWAVSLALSVGIFPYVLKLLQSSARELRPLLVFIWAKILAVDSSCQADLVKDNGHKYFLSVLADPYMPAEHRTMAVFILAVIVNNYNTGQEACLQGNLIAICLEQLSDPHPLLRQWVAICLGRIWQNFDSARWCGVRDSAHEKLYSLLSDPIPEVRCAAVFALGTFVGNSAERTDHSTTIDHNVAMMLAQLINDGSPVVRKELVVALSHLVVQYESNFCTVALQFMEEEKNYAAPSPANTTEPGNQTPVRESPAIPRLRSVNSYTNIRAATTARNLNKSLQNLNLNEEGGPVTFSPGNLSASSSASSTLGSPDNDEYILSFETIDKMRRVSSYSSLNSLIGVSFNSVYTQIWRVLLHLAADPFPEVSDLAMKVLNSIAYKATMNARPQKILDSGSLTQSAPASPTSKGTLIHQAGTSHGANRSLSHCSGSPPIPGVSSSSLTNEVPKPPTRDALPSRPPYTPTLGTQATPHSHQFQRTRKMFDKGPDQMAEDGEEAPGHRNFISVALQTGLCDWSAKYFAQPVMKIPEEHDLESQVRKEREWRFLRNAGVRRQSQRIIQRGITRLDDQIFINRNPGVPSVVKFHPFNPCIAVADKDSICFWDWEKGERLDYFYNGNPRYTRITAMEYLNGHDCSLLLTATDDGALRIWKNFADQRNPEMVTAWQGLSDMLPSTRGLARRVSIYIDRSKQGGAGMVVDWEQETGLLMTSGDVRVIRIWDTEREMKVQDIPTGADSCVTSLSCDPQRSLVVAGLGDGSVRVYDRRMAPNECRVMTYREHGAWVVKAHLQRETDGHIISVSVNGDVRFFDPRTPDSINVLQTVKGLTALDIHPQANLFACGSMNQFIAVYNSNGDVISNIKYYDGFMGQRIGAISCLAFHPYWPHLAVGSNDYYMSIYSAEKRLR
ncbi:regulatory-associated protein of mTOR isoform X1 [Pygocentrus nattereri]|uniref:regulatory-associated protein of mTOR isoform X1 n=1 Tax=Pygocentrus nattereri TaxID=42514 RepID=UPI00081476F6|nr:regulatory-associated protein of mTOR isoform X1 [Pygocentrus nattereri]XP_017548538.1 regulatory-associated protein of mTOR isoform X1 [Pygocentrus nattereri]XP_017548539.1 regulatory-associated protein of mTOR isoform X1 [Pygocentrus nattereri]XP_037392424.1 regulatory-associated protein of mTOR isoform X1 [Pygocentrus nattereri]XP_037392425.1 regulatory-associated protein of mTOR isoform X1 [Pygocentrus nattereri]